MSDGRFEELADEAGPGATATHPSRGCAFGDFDNDGDVDILIMNKNEPLSLLRNDVTGENHWIQFQLNAAKSNRSAIGSRVIVSYGGHQQAQEVLGQAGFLSVNSKRLHFGLGQSEKVNVEVRWPSGVRQQFSGITANQVITVDEARGIVDQRKSGG